MKEECYLLFLQKKKRMLFTIKIVISECSKKNRY